MRVGDLYIIAEDIVEADLERRNSRPLSLLLLHVRDPFFRRMCQRRQFVQFCVIPMPDYAGIGKIRRRGVDDCALDGIGNGVEGLQGRVNFGTRNRGNAIENVFQYWYSPQVLLHTHHVAGGGSPSRDLCDEALKISDLCELRGYLLSR